MNAVGLVFTATIRDAGVVIDISSASTKTFVFLKPDGTKITKAGLFVTTGADGQLKYTTVAGDLDQSGIWKMQAHVIAGSFDEYTDIAEFPVGANL